MKYINNHLHEIIKEFPEPIGNDFCNELSGLVHKIVSRKKWFTEAVAFQLGSYEDIINFKPIRELLILPFETCWFEFNVQFLKSEKQQQNLHRENVGVLVKKIDSRLHECMHFIHYKKQWYFIGWERIAIGEKVLWACGASGKDSNCFITTNLYSIIWRALYCSLSAINCMNVNIQENKPSLKLRKKSVKKRLPIFSTWTLHIKKNSPNKTQEPTTVDRNSPRVHLRRGHIRKYKTGKYTWVQPTVVGNGSGIICKDYKI